MKIEDHIYNKQIFCHSQKCKSKMIFAVCLEKYYFF